MKLHVIASSSSGNCALVSSDNTNILIDAGLPAREIFRALIAIGIPPEKLSAICLTHAHSDHAKGIEGIGAQLEIAIYMSTGTFSEIKLRKHMMASVKLFERGTSFVIGDIEVQTLPVPHDAPGAVAYSLRNGAGRITIATDLGSIPAPLAEYIVDSDTVLLESSYDSDVLNAGQYNEALRARISGPEGHLSNQAACEFIRTRLTAKTTRLVLGHVSLNGNSQELVRLSALAALHERGLNPNILEVT